MSRKPGSKQALFEQLALVARALGSAARLELLDYLAQGERTVETLAAVAGLGVANTSKHLQVLRAAGLVQSRRDGLHAYYRSSGDDVLAAVAALRMVAHTRLEEVERLVAVYLRSRDDLEPVAADELMARAQQGLVTVLDVRPYDEFVQGHLPGAVNVPLGDLQDHLDHLPRGQEVVAYCRGPWCVLSYEAVAMLRASGHVARRLDGGLPEWRQLGLPVSTGQGPGGPPIVARGRRVS